MVLKGVAELFKSKSLFKSQVNENKEQSEATESIDIAVPEAIETPETSDQTSENKSSDDPSLKEGFMKSKMTAASFGEMVSLLMRSAHYKHYSLADLEWLLLPPIMHNQFLVVEARSKENGASVPVGLALWASVSEEVNERLSENLDQPIKLRPDEWQSGEINWLVDMIGDDKMKQSMFQKIKSELPKKSILKFRAMNDQGQVIVKEIISE
jgi:hemolysin-activating ACP:hemolysin acyltransferase